MTEKNSVEVAIAIIIFIITASDFYKGVLMVFRKETPLLFMAQVSFLLLKLMPVSIQKARYEDAMNTYRERRKVYGIFALIGGPWGILLSLLIIHNA